MRRHRLFRCLLCSTLLGLSSVALLILCTPLPPAVSGHVAQNCSFSLAPTSHSFQAGGGSGSVAITASQPACAWTAISNDAWLSITKGATGAGNGSVAYTVAANPAAAPRTGTLTIAGETFTVMQAANLTGLQFYPLPRPVRLLDTRPGQGNCDNVGTPIVGGTSLTTQARVTCESITIPASAQAVVGNVTAINLTNQAGFLTLYPNGVPAPLAANMVYQPGQVLSNAFTVGLGANGAFDIFGQRTLDVVVDISGYYAPPGAANPGGLYFHPLPRPVRLLDTRAGEGNCDAVGTPIAAGTSLTTQARISCEGLTIPPAAQAVVGNATVINLSNQAGFLTLYPNGVPVPLAANMVYQPNQILANAFTVSLNGSGEFNIFGQRNIEMVVDVAGYYSSEALDANGPGLLFNPLPRPVRLLDTRAGEGNCDSIGTPIAAGTSLTTQARITCEGIPIPSTAQTVLGNVTVINLSNQAGFLTLYPNGVTAPLAANLVYQPSQILANAFVVGLSGGGEFNLFSQRLIEAIVDVSGYFAPAPLNTAPVVDAGADQTIAQTGPANLTGTVSDDGLPIGSTLTATWSKLSGPGTVTFGNANQVATTASFSVAGTYVLRLTGNDSQLTASDDVTITANPPLAVNAGADQVITLPNQATLLGTVTGGSGTATVAWSKVSGPGSVLFSSASALATNAIFALNGTYVLRLTAMDGQTTVSDDLQVTVNADPTPPPPDPSLVAPPLDMTVVTTIGAATEFLYTGPNPIQTGVAPGTIKPVRVAVLRGRVLDQNNAPLALVKVSLLDHPEYGQTLSRADGRFDLAVNGGSLLNLQYEKLGYLTLQRQLNVAWQDYCNVPDVMLMGYDPNVTLIDLTASTPIQVARGGVSTDSSGARRSTLLFKQGTTATMLLPGGAMQGLDKLHVRATEYTVGPNGDKAMPGDLPATSGYTYAAEVSVDEAVAAGAKSVVFSQPVINYLENFLDFPVGINVPSGLYDREHGIWMPAASGRVVKILAINSGVANLDLDGSGLPATDKNYAALGITVAERQQVATLYSSGQILWRVPIIHFTPVDHNWTSPPTGAASNQETASNDKKCDCPEEESGSIIETQSQTLGESIQLVGTPYTLNYRSDRVPGRTTAYRLTIPVSGASVPANLKRIELEILIAGRTFTQSFSNTPNQTTTFTWDGKDAYGRTIQGRQVAIVRVGYAYDAVYSATPTFGNYGDGTVISLNFARREVTLWQVQRLSIGTIDTRGQGLGGWTLDAHHIYDPNGQVVYLGDGRQRYVTSVSKIISTFAGGGTPADGVGDGLPATQAQLNQPEGGIAVAPDGSLYIADSSHHRIRKVGTNGIITTVAGTGTAGYNGDGMQATQARLNNPAGLALAPDGSLLISDTFNHRIRKVAPSGIITTIAGTGNASFSGDDGPATQAELNRPRSLALAPDGSLSFIDSFNFAVRRIAPDGIITTIGRGNPARPGSHRPTINVPTAVAIGPDGLLYLADTGNIYRINSDRSEVIVAGGGFPQDGLGDGLPATQARTSALALTFGPDGSLYIAEATRIRAVGPNGIITTIAGHGNFAFSGDGGPAPLADFSGPVDVARGQDGSLYIVDSSNHRIRKITAPLPGFSATDLAVVSEGGDELYQFNSVGKHLRTLNTLTGATLFSFTYDSAGRLTQVTDGDNNVTTIERNGSGTPTAIVAPFGQRTTLTLNANGFINTITDPASQAYQLSYTAAGLLTNLTDPRGNASSFTYDALGRLMKDTNAANGFSALARTEQSQQYNVSLTTALNRTTSYQVQTTATGDEQSANTDTAGLQTQTLRRKSGLVTTTAPDEMVFSATQGGDPRWGLQAPLSASFNLTTPGNLSFNRTFARSVTLSNPADLLSLATQNDTTNINGRVYTTNYTAATRTFIYTTPQARQITTTTDTQGRITAEQFTNLEPAAYTYDTRGRLMTAAFSTGGGARTASYAYNATSGFLSSITNPLTQVTSFSYDNAGRVIQRTLPDTRVIGYGYDATGNVTSFTPPGRPAHTFSYSPVDLLTTYTPPTVPGTGPTQFAYNLDKQLTTVTRPDALTINFGYDAAGRPQTLTTPSGAYNYTYSGTTGNLTSLSAPGNQTLNFSYDGSLLTATSWAGPVTGSVSRTFDNNFRVTAQSVNGANTVNFSYDDDNLLTGTGALSITRHAQNGLVTATTLSGVTDTWGYNGFGELASYSASFNATPLYATTYTRDKLGRITQKVETINGVINTYDYSYDTTGRLSTVKLNNTTISTYAYDSNSNRTSLTTPGGKLTGSYDAQDRMTAYGATTYAYTANGELSSKTVGAQTTAYGYDVLGNLRQVTLPGGTQIEYLIDGQNRRVGKKVNGALVQGWLYQNQLAPVAELDGSNNLVSRFVYGTRPHVPDYVVKGGVSYRLFCDQIGSVRLVVNAATGAIAQRLDYDEFGVVLNDTNPGFQPFGFAGGLYDQHTRLTRFGARDYDADTGRWTAKDPLMFGGGNANLYLYAFNDPINLFDPSGLQQNSAQQQKQEVSYAIINGQLVQTILVGYRTVTIQKPNCPDLIIKVPVYKTVPIGTTPQSRPTNLPRTSGQKNSGGSFLPPGANMDFTPTEELDRPSNQTQNNNSNSQGGQNGNNSQGGGQFTNSDGLY